MRCPRTQGVINFTRISLLFERLETADAGALRQGAGAGACEVGHGERADNGFEPASFLLPPPAIF